MQVAGPSASYGFLSVRLQDLHLYRVMRLVMMLAGLAEFFNLPIGLLACSGSVANIYKISENGLAVFRIVNLWMELHPESGVCLILHSLDLARAA